MNETNFGGRRSNSLIALMSEGSDAQGFVRPVGGEESNAAQGHASVQTLHQHDGYNSSPSNVGSMSADPHGLQTNEYPTTSSEREGVVTLGDNQERLQVVSRAERPTDAQQGHWNPHVASLSNAAAKSLLQDAMRHHESIRSVSLSENPNQAHSSLGIAISMAESSLAAESGVVAPKAKGAAPCLGPRKQDS